jgi:hypothetical protein
MKNQSLAKAWVARAGLWHTVCPERTSGRFHNARTNDFGRDSIPRPGVVEANMQPLPRFGAPVGADRHLTVEIRAGETAFLQPSTHGNLVR